MTAASIAVPRRMNFEEFLQWARSQTEDVSAELVEGNVEFMSPVSAEHQSLGAFLLAILFELADSRQLGRVFYESFVMRAGPQTGREPDILFVATHNLHRLRENHLEGPADLVIEIVSPESRTRDRVTKRAEYERLGVPEYWVLDQAQREALFYQLQADGTYRLVAADEQNIYRSSAMPDLWIDVGWLWQSPLPTLLSILRHWQLI